MATSAETDNKVLSDVHVHCFLNSENTDIEKKSIEPQKWLSRFYFWLPQISMKIQQPCRTLYETSDQICKNHPSCYTANVNLTLDKLEKELLELDEDGDIILVRRQKQNLVQNGSAVNIPCRPVNLLHIKDSDICPLSVKDSEDFTSNHVTGCRSIASVHGDRKDFLTDVDRTHENTTDNVTEECDRHLGTKHSYSCEQAVALTCKNNKMSSRLLDEDYSQTEENIGKAQHFSLNEERPDYEVLTLEHSMETIIPEVGMQIWSGALLLCDYLIHNHRDLDSSTVLDLGAGTGITSIVAAMFTPHVLCTDYLASIVELSERNWERNRDLLSKRSCDQIVFKILDWTSDWSSPAAASESKYTITSDDLKFIEDATLILAAEVIYDEELTDGFFQTIYNLLMKSPPKTVLLTVEKRIIFSTDNQDICSPAYEHFLENLNDLVTVDEGLVYFTSEKMNTTFPLYFQYQRVKELELWQITSQICVSP